jgi:hypothetical protein
MEGQSMTRAKVAVWLFAAVSVLSFGAALIPVLKGEQANAVFLGNGVLFLVIAVASAKKARAAGKGPPAA